MDQLQFRYLRKFRESGTREPSLSLLTGR